MNDVIKVDDSLIGTISNNAASSFLATALSKVDTANSYISDFERKASTDKINKAISELNGLPKYLVNSFLYVQNKDDELLKILSRYELNIDNDSFVGLDGNLFDFGTTYSWGDENSPVNYQVFVPEGYTGENVIFYFGGQNDISLMDMIYNPAKQGVYDQDGKRGLYHSSLFLECLTHPESMPENTAIVFVVSNRNEKWDSPLLKNETPEDINNMNAFFDFVQDNLGAKYRTGVCHSLGGPVLLKKIAPYVPFDRIVACEPSSEAVFEELEFAVPDTPFYFALSGIDLDKNGNPVSACKSVNDRIKGEWTKFLQSGWFDNDNWHYLGFENETNHGNIMVKATKEIAASAFVNNDIFISASNNSAKIDDI